MSSRGIRLLLWLYKFKLGRIIMQALVATIFRVAFNPLVSTIVALLGPMLRSYTFDKTQLKTILEKVSLLMQGQTVTYAVMGDYTAAEQQAIVTGIYGILTPVLVEYKVTVPATDLGRLLDAVADAIPVV